MKQAFLEKLATHVFNNFPHLGNRLCIVLPNRRAGLFLKRYLAQQHAKPVWAPDILPIEDFTSRLSGYTTPDTLQQMSAIYQAHQQIEREEPLDFDEFYARAYGMLHDFEEIDHYLADVDQLFDYLSESKAIALWNVQNEPLTTFEKNYLEFFSAMKLYYRIFRQELLNRKLATQGMSTRILVESENPPLTQPWEHIIFAGFNALTPAQLSLIKMLTAHNKASLMWDADTWFMDNELQEAGTFLRQYRKDKDLGDFGDVGDHFKESAHAIEIIGVPGSTGQANIAGHLIKKLLETNENALSTTAVILADENLLLPLLNCIPAEAGTFNITMGYPLTQSPLYQLFNNIITLHVNAANNSFRYYYKDLLSILRHPFAGSLFSPQHREALITRILQSKRSYYALNDLKLNAFSDPSFQQEIELIATPCSSASALAELLQQCIARVKSVLTAGENKMQAVVQILFNLSRILNRLQQFISSNTTFATRLSTFQLLFSDAARQMPVAFYGEPLQGIQIMGLLESRTLDFDNIILLSANEGILPSAKPQPGYIPFDVRMHFGLPTHRDQQAIYAYHFYRLLMRSRNAWLIYNSESDQLGGGERSRFLAQIQIEMPAYSSQVHITESTPSLTAGYNPVANIEVPKNEQIIERLHELARKGFSPTSLSSYLNCSLRFYFNYVLRLNETEEAEEHIDHRTLGTVVHAAMQNVMQPLLNQHITADKLKAVSKNIDTEVSKAFRHHFPEGDIETGRNLLIATLAKKWVTLALEKEISAAGQSAKVILLELEKSLRRTIQIPSAAGSFDVALTGQADRIDLCNNELLIIDYKTGKVAAHELRIKSLDEIFDTEKQVKEKAFQLLFYIYLAKGDAILSLKSGNVNAALFSFRSIAEGKQTLNFTGDTASLMELFEQELIDLIAEIFNPEIAFTQTTNEKSCAFCAFKEICQR